jgi:hypothetical protein
MPYMATLTPAHCQHKIKYISQFSNENSILHPSHTGLLLLVCVWTQVICRSSMAAFVDLTVF